MCWASHLTASLGGTASPLATTIATRSSVKRRSIEASSSVSGKPLRKATSAAPRIWMRNGWMKFMWPTWPIVGFSACSPVSTRLPPWRPATQCRPSRAWLSSKIRSTLTCRAIVGSPVIGIRARDDPSR
jgi:hypothetical protein